ncbi:MAG: class I SAM-dependent methyltransferase [Bacteroidota bacterium]
MQRTDEWIKNFNEDYFNRQFQEPYRSTVAFCDWLDKIGVLRPDSPANILDIATGKGANIYYMSQRYKNMKFMGVDINESFVDEGNAIMKAKNVADRCVLETGDIYNFDKKHYNAYDGIVCYQTLSWLPDYKEPLKAMSALGAGWIALTSLFFDGDVNCRIELDEYNKGIDNAPKNTFYNVYSLPLIQKFFTANGYSEFMYMPFEIDIDIPKPDHKIMGTYTEKLQNGHRIQVSGPLLMNWYFVIALR